MPQALKERLKLRNDSTGSSTSDEEVHPSIVPLFKLAPAKLYNELAPLMLSFVELSEHGYPFMSQNGKHAVFAPISPNVQRRDRWRESSDPERKCARCQMTFVVDDLGNFPDAPCTFHHRSQNDPKTNKRYLPCCRGQWNVKKCCTAKCHVTSEMAEEALYDFVKTPKPNGDNDYRSKKVYALDTEAVYTKSGLEVARVSLVDMKGRTVMDMFVLPRNPVIDYNTEYSGIRAKDMEQAVSLAACRRQLFQFINSDTILIGHSLENDFRYLRLAHHSVIDTAIVFPSVEKGVQRKLPLRTLAWRYLEKEIQGGERGHSSIEDAATCVQLLVARYFFFHCFSVFRQSA